MRVLGQERDDAVHVAGLDRVGEALGKLSLAK
jgi:hypothetical protein